MKPPRYCLDSWAVLRYLEGRGPAARHVRRVLRAERPLMSWINLGEVLYVLIRRAGEREASGAVGELRRRLTLDPATPERVLAAASIKAAHAMAYADAFAVATAQAHEATLLTGDPEIARARGPWSVERLADG